TVEGLAGVRSQRRDNRRPKRDVGHEMSVHHVEMDPVGAGGGDRAHLLAELGEIRRQDRGRHDHRAHCAVCSSSIYTWAAGDEPHRWPDARAKSIPASSEASAGPCDFIIIAEMLVLINNLRYEFNSIAFCLEAAYGTRLLKGTLDAERIASPSQAAGSRVHSHHAGSRRRDAQPRHAVLDRQGLERDASRGDESLLSGQAAVSAAACRHDLEVPRDDRVSRRDGAAARPRPDRPYQSGWPQARDFADHLRLAAPHP